jgi:putative sigma-54 modulation protein
MQLHITARHLDLTPALADYVQKRLDRVERHFPEVMRAQMILTVEKHRHIAEIVAHANGHHDFRAKGEAADLYAAVDMVAEKLHKHMSRQKDKRVRGRRRVGRLPVEISTPVLPTDGMDGQSGRTPPITRVRRFTPKPMTVAEAVESLEGNDLDFVVFSSDDNMVHVLYKRKDKTYGLLEVNS